MDDITTRLRQTRADMIGTDDEGHYFDCHEAAGEIERLRQWGRLTDAERSDLAIAADAYENNNGDSDCERIAATLRGLLQRLSAERPLGDPEIEVEILRRRVAELEEAIRRLADQDATLSVCNGSVTVTMDATLTDAEREAIRVSIQEMRDHTVYGNGYRYGVAATLQSMLSRMGDCPAADNVAHRNNGTIGSGDGNNG